jgi:hypothetical protein
LILFVGKLAEVVSTKQRNMEAPLTIPEKEKQAIVAILERSKTHPSTENYPIDDEDLQYILEEIIANSPEGSRLIQEIETKRTEISELDEQRFQIELAIAKRVNERDQLLKQLENIERTIIRDIRKTSSQHRQNQ